MSYQDFKNAPSSKKIVLATIDSALRVVNYEPDGLGGWQIATPWFIVGLIVDGDDRAFTFSPGLVSFGGAEPSVVFLRVRHFYANIPQVLPWDLDSGIEVEWDARIRGEVGDLKLDLDYQNTGIAIETNSSINLENNDAYFDDIFDTHIWEGGRAVFYSWSDTLQPSEAMPFYRGIVTEKSFSPQSIRFTLRDQLSVLRQNFPAPLFETADFTGQPNAKLLGKPKRTIYGQFDKLRLESVDITGAGYLATGTFSGSADRNLLTGTVSAASASTTINGSGTQFITQGLAPGVRIRVIAGNNEYNFTIATVPSETQITVTQPTPAAFSNASVRNLEVRNNEVLGVLSNVISEIRQGDDIRVTVDGIEYRYSVESVFFDGVFLSDDIERTFTNATLVIAPFRPRPFKNRRWHIAHHSLYSKSFEIVVVLSPTRVEVDTVEGLRVGDLVDLDGNALLVSSISGNTVSFNVGLPFGATNGDTFSIVPVSNAYLGQRRLVYPRDYTLEAPATLVLSEDAEFNITRSVPLPIQLAFTNGTPQATPVAFDGDLTQFLRPGDFVRPNNPTIPGWLEVLQVFNNLVDFTSDYTGPTITSSIVLRSPDYASDDSLVTVDTKGMGDTTWVRTPADAVEDILDRAGITFVDAASFAQAKQDCQFDLSYSIPAQLGGNQRDIRGIITEINGSVFGSLTLGPDFNLRYNVLNADKPEGVLILGDEDVIGYSVSSKNEIKDVVILNYRPSTDLVTGQAITSEIVEQSSFTQKITQITDALSVTSFLFNESDAQIIAERWLFFRSQANSLVTLNTKLQLIDASLNEVVGLQLRRLYRRFGGGDRLKLGLINSISKDGLNTTVQINDLGNILNRVGAIAPDTQDDYSGASRLEVAQWAFIVDNQTETPGDENELGNNLIG